MVCGAVCGVCVSPGAHPSSLQECSLVVVVVGGGFGSLIPIPPKNSIPICLIVQTLDYYT